MIELKEKQIEFEGHLQHLAQELRGIRSGRAHPSFVENIVVEAYGTRTPLAHLGSISIPDARSILITPWDTSILKDIEHALTHASIGATPINDGSSLRIVLPQLTEETRKQLIKVVGQKLESTRVRFRSLRDSIREEVGRLGKGGDIREDDKFRLFKDIDEMTRGFTSKAETMASEKEREILTV